MSVLPSLPSIPASSSDGQESTGAFVPIVGSLPSVLPHRWTVAQVEDAIRKGVLSENDRCELIRGELIDKMVIGDPHMAAVKLLNHWFTALAARRYVVGVQDAIKLRDSRPEPDITLLQYRDDYYRSETPTPRDVLLLIEVADTSLEYDRRVKGPLYAENGIREFWIVNLIDDCIEVSAIPQADGRYDSSRIVRRGEELGPEAIGDLRFAADQILGPAKG